MGTTAVLSGKLRTYIAGPGKEVTQLNAREKIKPLIILLKEELKKGTVMGGTKRRYR
jgi:hypothetical protein